MPKKIIFVHTLMLLAAGYGLAQTNCPFGLTDDPAPGQCGSYIDGNGDNICDKSQDLAQSSIASTGGAGTNSPASVEEPSENDNSAVAEQESEALPEPEVLNAPEVNPEKQAGTMVSSSPKRNPIKLNRLNYHPWLLLFMVAVLAIVGEIWQRQDSNKILPIQTAWNWMLLTSFFASSLTGLYFILPPGSRPTITFNLSYWHSITGLVFIYIGLYHALRRATCLIRGARTCIKRTPCC